MLIEDGHKKIHVNRGTIDSNRKHGTSNDPIAVRVHKTKDHKTANEIKYGSTISIIHEGEVVARFIYDPGNPLSCGAKLWVETDEKVEVE